MSHEIGASRMLSDLAHQAVPAIAGTLGWVGMGEIEMPVRILEAQGDVHACAAHVDAFVNLMRPEARGIHMSRLYVHLDRTLSEEPLSPCSLRRLLKEFLESHAGLSDRAMIRVRFDYLVRRPALVSDNTGWKSYPATVTAVLDRGAFVMEIGVQATYSSTCPCSASLARQLVQENFVRDFPIGAVPDRDAVFAWLGSEQAMDATPHSQRSTAEVKARLAPTFLRLPFLDIIDRIENALGTPVQTAVKREDEQAFARLNGQNLMFCEDAARRMQAALNADDRISDFWVRATHLESLHAHNAVAIATKGVDGGFSA